MRIEHARMFVLGVAFVVSSCGSDSNGTPSTANGGSSGSGGSVAATGGSSGSPTGGGGVANPTGGSATGGAATGGSAIGGAATGGTSAGGTSAGGTSTGGTSAGGTSAGGTSAGGTSAGGTSVQPEAFEVQGKWLYLGPWDALHWLEISNTSMVYTDTAGEWSSKWTIKEYDNQLHHFQLVFESGIGTYSPVGQNLSGVYALDGSILTVQLANGLESYPPLQSPGSCTVEGATRIPDCGLYMRQN